MNDSGKFDNAGLAAADHPDESRLRIAVLIHNFPRFPTDISGIGFQPLFKVLQKKVDLEFIVPHDQGLPLEDSLNGLSIHRFRYANDDCEVLAYRGEMHRRILRHPITGLQFFKSYQQKAAEIADLKRCSLLWAHWWIPGGMAAARVAKKLNLPVVVTCHGTDIHLLHKFSWMRPLARSVFRQARAITVVSSFLKENLLGALGDADEELERKITVAPLIVDKSKVYFDPEQEKRPNSIICAARFTHQKNIDVVIKAVANLKSDSVDCSLDIVGDGPIKAELEQLIKKLNVGDRIKLREPVTQAELADYYRGSEIAVLVSEREGFGLTLLEAMMCGCAGIGARSGGLVDIISESGRDGILVEPRNITELTAALKSLLTDRDRLRQIADAGRHSVVQRFSDQELAEKFLAQLT